MLSLFTENGLFSTLYPNQVFHVDQGYEPSGDPAQTNSGIMYLYEDGTTGMPLAYPTSRIFTRQ